MTGRDLAANVAGQVVLSLFPGADLFGRAFEQKGFCVVRGPDALLEQYIADFHVPPGRFDGIIGGPPCQAWSTAAITGSSARDLIPEFVRIAQEARPRWIVMECVPPAMHSADVPASWAPTLLRDVDCGGLTMRTRVFWFWPGEIAFFVRRMDGSRRGAAYSVLKSSHKGKHGARTAAGRGRGYYPTIERAGELMGFPELGAALAARSRKKDNDMNRSLAFTLLGNGVPLSMGRVVADAVVDWLGGGFASRSSRGG